MFEGDRFNQALAQQVAGAAGVEILAQDWTEDQQSVKTNFIIIKKIKF